MVEEGQEASEILREHLSTIMLRRTQAEVLQQVLPPRTDRVVYLALSAAQRVEYEQCIAGLGTCTGGATALTGAAASCQQQQEQCCSRKAVSAAHTLSEATDTASTQRATEEHRPSNKKQKKSAKVEMTSSTSKLPLQPFSQIECVNRSTLDATDRCDGQGEDGPDFDLYSSPADTDFNHFAGSGIEGGSGSEVENDDGSGIEGGSGSEVENDDGSGIEGGSGSEVENDDDLVLRVVVVVRLRMTMDLVLRVVVVVRLRMTMDVVMRSAAVVWMKKLSGMRVIILIQFMRLSMAFPMAFPMAMTMPMRACRNKAPPTDMANTDKLTIEASWVAVMPRRRLR